MKTPPFRQLSLDPEKYERPRLAFEGGALVLKAVERDAEGLPDYFVWHAGHWVAPAFRYPEIKRWLASRTFPITNNAPRYLFASGFRFERQDGLRHTPEPEELFSETRQVAEERAAYRVSSGPVLRPYQKEAIESWLALEGRGTIVLPTGAGKSVIATLAIDAVKAPSLIIVPSLDLLHQWYENLCNTYGSEQVGVYFGEKKDLRPITVTTYASASSRLEELGNRFYLLICDEVHHLTAATWQQAARFSLAPRRLALTATYPGEFEEHVLLQELIGPPCYYKAPAELAGQYLAEYQTVRVRVDFTESEATEYEKLRAFYTPLAQQLFKSFGQGWYNRLMREQNRNSRFRQALVYKARMDELVEMARSKRLALARILALHRGQSAIIFTETNRAVYEMAEQFLLPAITYQTPAAERKAILDGFRAGEFPVIVTARVLNEGVDLPTAKVAIIVGGGGSSTEYIQRLGRILRRQGGAKAFLYELIVRDSLEENVSSRRRAAKQIPFQ